MQNVALSPLFECVLLIIIIGGENVAIDLQIK